MSLSAPKNLSAYTLHIQNFVPAFIEKLERTVSPSDRDVGFRTIANDFEDERKQFMTDFCSQIKKSFQSFRNIRKITADSDAYKNKVHQRLYGQWLELKAPAFNRTLRLGGVVKKGASKAKGLENGCNWDQELAEILAPGFLKWNVAYSEALKIMRKALLPTLDQFYHIIMNVINDSNANLVTVEKAKMKWKPLRYRMQAMITCFMDKVVEEQEHLYHRATMKDDRQNNLIAITTGPLYSSVFHALPALKSTPAGKPLRYVTSKVQHQKSMMEEKFLGSKNHFVDRFVNDFKDHLDAKMEALINEAINGLNNMFATYYDALSDHAPIDYEIDSRGEEIREQLKELIPELKKMSDELKTLLPVVIKTEDSAMTLTDASDDLRGETKNLQHFIDQAMKNKEKRPKESSGTKTRIKKEGGGSAKRTKY